MRPKHARSADGNIGTPERMYSQGFKDACERLSCGHPRACLADPTTGYGKCLECARLEQLLAASGTDVNLEERSRLVAIAREAAAAVVPRDTVQWLDGVQHGADIVIKALEGA
jgi:hypothetical protein